MVGCCVPKCSNSTRKGFRCFAFPRDPERRKKWLLHCKRDNWTPTSHSALCEAHFEADQFESKRQDGWRKLKPNAVPTIFRQMGSKKRPPSKARKRTKVAKSAMMRHQLRRQADALARQQDDDVRQVLVEAMLIEAPSTSSCTSQFATDTSMASVYPLNIKQEPENCSLSCSPRNVAENEEFISPDPPETAVHSINIKQEPQDEFPSSPTNYEETSEYCVETPEVTMSHGVNIKEERVDICEASSSSQSSTVSSQAFADHKPMVIAGNLLTADTSEHCYPPSAQLKEHNEDAKTLERPSNQANYEQQNEEQAFQCSTCPAVFHDSSLLKAHHLNVHNSKVFMCDKCSVTFSRAFSLRRHMKLHAGRGSHTCPSMPAEETNLMNHVHTGSIEGPYTGSADSLPKGRQCPTAFIDLKGHTRRTHASERPYRCELCPAAFAERGTLARHTSTHTSERKFQCDLCPARFSEAYKLRRHARTHTGERPYKCERCPAAFSQLCHLKKHACTHNVGVRSYGCQQCPAVFTALRSLEGHVRTHDGEKLHRCRLCPAKFAYLHCLNRHARVHTGERQYKCESCSATFSEPHHLKVHMHSHSDERTFECSLCPAAFKHSSNLKRHMRVHVREKPDVRTVSAPTLTELPALECRVQTEAGEVKLG